MRYLPPDISYGIECAAECNDITADVSRFFHTFNDRDITGDVDALDNPRIDWESCHRRYGDLYTRLYDEWFNDRANNAQRAWCLVAAATPFARLLGETIDFIYTKYISHRLADCADPADMRAASRYLDADQRWLHIVSNTTKLVDRHHVATLTPERITMARINPREAFAEARIGMEEPRAGRLVYSETHANVQWRDYSPREIKVARKKANKVLKKSSMLLSRILGKQDTIAFIRGEEIEVVGQRYTFVLRKTNLLSNYAHGFTIRVIHRASGERMVNLCWYVESTPALDQIAALVMAVKTGDEEEIIRVGNHLAVTQASLENVDFASLSKHVPPSANQVVGNLEVEGEIRTPFGIDEDRICHNTPGTAVYQRDHPETFVNFVNMANAQIETITMGLPPVVTPYYALRQPHQVRRLTETHLGELINRDDQITDVIDGGQAYGEITAREIVFNAPPAILMPLVNELNAMEANYVLEPLVAEVRAA